MRASDAHRADMLVEALAELHRVLDDLRNPCQPTQGDERALEISAPCICEAGAETNAYIYLPPDLGEKLVPFIEQLVRSELAAIGVTVDEPIATSEAPNPQDTSVEHR